MEHTIGFFRKYQDETGKILSRYVRGLRAKFFWSTYSEPVTRNRFNSWDGIRLKWREGGERYSRSWFCIWGGSAVSSHSSRREHLKRILSGMRKNPDRFKTITRRFSHVNSEQLGNYLNQRERFCYVSGEKTPYYRLGGSNTFYSDGNESISLEGLPISRSVTGYLKDCNGCERKYTQWSGFCEDLEYIAELGDYLCPECYDAVGECSICERPTRFDSCNDCKNHEETPLHQWGYNPPFWKYGRYDGKGVKYTSHPEVITEYLQGLEFEFEFPDGEGITGKARELQKSMKSDYVYFTTDSSLNNGIELHTQPATLEAVKRIDWDKMYEMEGACFRSDRNGIHVHTNREAYKPLHMGKIAKFHRKCTGLTMAVADRVKQSQFNNYARFYSSSLLRIEREAISQAKAGNGYFKARIGERTDAINCTKKSTIEFRWGGGCEVKADLFRKLEYIDAVFKFTANCSNLDLNGRSFLKWVRGEKTYPNLNQWLEGEAGSKAVKFSGTKPEQFR